MKDCNVLSGDLLDLISEVVKKNINSFAKQNKLLKIQPVVVASYNSGDNTATIIFPQNPEVESNYSYVNKTGRLLTNGEKIYLISVYGNLSQGWLNDNLPLTII